MATLIELAEEFRDETPPSWLQEAEDEDESALWGLEDETYEPDVFDQKVENWFRELSEYLDELSRNTRKQFYKLLCDRVLTGIETFRGMTKGQAVDCLVEIYGGKTGELVDDRDGMVWSRLTLCSGLSPWVNMIDALPDGE